MNKKIKEVKICILWFYSKLNAYERARTHVHKPNALSALF